MTGLDDDYYKLGYRCPTNNNKISQKQENTDVLGEFHTDQCRGKIFSLLLYEDTGLRGFLSHGHL
jgi:hypothetical protein